MQTVSTDQLVGQTVGQYNVESLLGRGRLSAVYLARHSTQKNTVALTTFILPERFSAEARTRFMQRFRREAAPITALSHRNLLPILEYSEKFGYPYLITPYMTNGSLADVLKQQGRCTPTSALNALEQVAAGLEYAHRKGVVHGTLKPSNILLNDEQSFLVAGFGLAHMLQIRGIEPNEQPYANLLSIADTFLYASTYIAPEVVQGQPVDPRSDIYALGIILFEMLNGKPPFIGASPLDTAMQHVQQPLPSLHKLCPDVPIAMELVINHALARDPNQRFQYVSELVEAFTQVCRGIASRPQQRLEGEITYHLNEAPSSNSLQNVQEEDVSIGNWQLTPPIITGKTATIRPSAEETHSAQKGAKALPPTTDTWQIVPPIITGHLAAVKPGTPSRTTRPLVKPVAPSAPFTVDTEMQGGSSQQTLSSKPSVQPERPVQPVQPALMAHSMLDETTVKNPDSMDTPAWWVQSSSVNEAPGRTPASGPTNEKVKLSTPETMREKYSEALGIAARTKPLRTSSKRAVNRRRVVALLATGGVAAAGALIAIDMNLKHIMTPLTPHQGSTQTRRGNGGQQKRGSTGGKGGHTGTVVGNENLAINSSTTFTNPVDGKSSLLIHLSNGHFVSYDRACTHEGVEVNYDAATRTIVCPAHGSVFDPANGAKVLQGPAMSPLASVAIRVNADGTITTG